MITSCGPSCGGGGNQNVYNVKSIETHREAIILKSIEFPEDLSIVEIELIKIMVFKIVHIY